MSSSSSSSSKSEPASICRPGDYTYAFADRAAVTYFADDLPSTVYASQIPLDGISKLLVALTPPLPVLRSDSQLASRRLPHPPTASTARSSRQLLQSFTQRSNPRPLTHPSPPRGSRSSCRRSARCTSRGSRTQCPSCAHSSRKAFCYSWVPDLFRCWE